MLDEFEQRGLIHPGDSGVALEQLREPARTLSFPGKVLAAADRLFIADSNHHRIVVASLDGAIQQTIGSGTPALIDGAFQQAAFQQPQGLALRGEQLYIADTENHAIRLVDLDRRTVTTIAGTGAQALRPGDAGPATSTALSSPWDLVRDGSQLYVAMAGLHQIWRIDLERDIAAPFAGTGREGLRDGPLREAWFAQSSGLALADRQLYSADSEVSAVREIDLTAGVVRTIVGEDLFVFGDQDGEGDAIRLQHPLGIAARDGVLYVADSYNNKIKTLDPVRRSVATWLGSGAAGRNDGQGAAAAFREPGGISASAGGLYIADTNNHRIAFADWQSAEVRSILE
jgi:sugar lactone lactonase YvrE